MFTPASSQQNLYDIHLLLCVQCWTPDDGQTDCPKYVEFHSKNKFEKLVHLVGFVKRIEVYVFNARALKMFYIYNQQMHIYKYVQPHFTLFNQHVSITHLTITRVADNKNTSNILYILYPCYKTPC